MNNFRYIVFLFLLFTAYSCDEEEPVYPPDKLTGNKAFLVGKWQWIYSHEYKKNLNTNVTTASTVLASDYPDTYSLMYFEWGQVMMLKNADVEQTEFLYVNGVSTNQYCSFTNGTRVSFNFQYIDYPESSDLSSCGKKDRDTISTGSTNLPLVMRTENSYSYSYSHFYRRVE